MYFCDSVRGGDVAVNIFGAPSLLFLRKDGDGYHSVTPHAHMRRHSTYMFESTERFESSYKSIDLSTTVDLFDFTH